MPTSAKPRVSVVIPVKNGGELLITVLQRVLSQQTPWPFEVLVIDSGSRDGSQARVQQLGVRLHEIPPTEFGHGRTRNLGVGLTQGEFIAFLTQDALPADEHWLRELVSAMELAPDTAGAFGPHLPHADCNPLTARELIMHFQGFGEQPNVTRLEDPERYGNDPGYRQFLHYFSSNNACIRRSVWDQIPLPDVDFSEDQLWAQKAVEAGYSRAYAPSARVHHSHNFGVREGYRRAFDESRALKRLFGYNLVPNLRHLLGHWRRMVWRDWHWVREAHLSLTQTLYWWLRIPALNLAKLSGFYLGGRQEQLPGWLVEYLSRDKRLQRS